MELPIQQPMPRKAMTMLRTSLPSNQATTAISKLVPWVHTGQRAGKPVNCSESMTLYLISSKCPTKPLYVNDTSIEPYFHVIVVPRKIISPPMILAQTHSSNWFRLSFYIFSSPPPFHIHSKIFLLFFRTAICFSCVASFFESIS